MSIKDLFGKTSPSLEETVQDVESVAFVEEKTKADQTYHPQIDFSVPANFAYYGSAELYYDAAIRRIYEDYPYDGSKSEQIEFEEKASALERWIFETKYPKTTGHVQLGTSGLLTAPASPSNFSTTTTPEYIKVWGGLHTNTSATTLTDHFQSSARFDNDKNRNQNWNVDLDKGITVEFWFKKNSYDTVTSPIEVILDLWNGGTVGSTDECRIVISTGQVATVDTMFFTLRSGGVSQTGQFVIASSSSWNHYSISFHNTSAVTNVTIHVNGDELGSVASMGSLFASFSGRINGFIGALQDEFQVGNGSTGGGKLSAQIDEFRFWKTKRTSRQIKLNWFNSIGGGANTDDATSDLGVYLKFNEGIVGNNAIDSVILDYSGRLANGVWTGYESTNSARSTESAMGSTGYTETPSPIIYKEHSSVSTLISEMQTSGSVYDADRGQSFFRSMPTWLQEEDNGNLRIFSQILASYMDTLHVQIKELTELKSKRYPMEGVKASTMAADLLKDKGFMVSTMFESNEVYEKLSSINLKDAQFETELHEIKNIIYINIYNNLEKIYKTKGTEGSIRNLIRCFGIDDELIKLNLYTDGGIQYLTDKSRETSVKKKYINFNDPTRFEGSIHQVTSSTNSNSFISSAVDASRNAFTMEADIVVPYKKEVDEKGYFATPFLSSSIMGFHEAAANPAVFTWGTQNLSVYLVRDSLNSKHAKFVMRDILGNINEESGYIYDIYENEHYNVALRIKPQTYPYAGGVTNTTPNYDIELYAVTTNFGEIENEVILSTTITNAAGVLLMNASKRVYAGAHVVDFTGAIAQESDLQIGGVRAWLDYLGNEEILQHNKDVLNYGMRSSIDGANLYLIDNVQVPTQDLTILNWDFDTVTTSNASGEFEVEDITSGSSDTIYGWIDDVIRREHKAKGTDFLADDTSVVGHEFIQAYKKQLPESAYDAQSIYIKGEQEINFSNDDDVSDNLFVMEKSPASLISEEMLKSFSTTLEFANLFARPIERFRVEYKDLARARQLFFDRVESDMDFDRFFEYFKWIDSSISSMVNQLIPMSANFAGGIVDVVEPHILERDKYQRQVGLLNTITSTEASIRGAQELKYNWRVGHAPLSGNENENCLWQKERKERSVTEEETIRQVIIRQNDQEFTNPVALSSSIGIISGSYAARRLSRPYTLDIGFGNSIHGGINYSQNKDRDMITSQIAAGNASNAGTPENVVIIGAGVGTGTNPKPACVDEQKPEELRKYKYDGFAVLGKHAILATQEPKSDEDGHFYRQKISKIIPGNIVSSSVNTGYSSLINNAASIGGFGEGFDMVNLHSDTTDITNEISIQGPFTHTHIGGRQSRHIHYMEGFDVTAGKIPNIADRPESWNIYIAELDATDTAVATGVGDGAIGFATPDYSVGVLDSDQQKATLYREERAKRPVNIKNIQTIIGAGTHGNFTYNYEVMSTFGDQGYFLRRAGNLLPAAIGQELPETTNYQTLIAQTASVSGNHFGEGNNRQYEPTITIATPAVSASDTFRLHQNGTSLDPDSLPLFEIRIGRATGLPIRFAVAPSSGGQSGTIAGPATLIDTTGTTWSNIAFQFVTAIEHVTNGFPNVQVTAVYNSSGPDGEEVTFTVTEDLLIGTLGNGGVFSTTDPTHLEINNGAFVGGTDQIVSIGSDGSIVETQDRSTGSANVIRTRFSAPGGPEINSSGYLDVTSQQYSVYNSINFRNLSTRITGSGEIGTIRVDSQASRREGLRMLRTRHQGQFGIDSTHGAISATDYVAEASFHKQHRNGSDVLTVIDKLSIGVRFSNTTNEFAILSSLSSDGEVDNQQGGLSFSFWLKLDSTSQADRGILDSENLKIWRTSSGSSYDKMLLRFRSTYTSPWLSVQFDLQSFDLENWNHFIISCDLLNLENCRMTVSGTESTQLLATLVSIVNSHPIFPFGGYIWLGKATAAPTATVNVLFGSIMNFAYFDSFILNNNEDVEILQQHRNGSEISQISSLVAFWFLGEEVGLATNTVLPNATPLVTASYGRINDGFRFLNAVASTDVSTVDGFYGYLAGEKQGEQRRDNDHLGSLLPASDFQYSWIKSAISGSNWESGQNLLTYAPKSGLISSEIGPVEAISFPSASLLYGE